MNVRAWTYFKGSKVLVNRVEIDVQRTQMKSQGSPSTVNRKQHCVINKRPTPHVEECTQGLHVNLQKQVSHKSVCVCDILFKEKCEKATNKSTACTP